MRDQEIRINTVDYRLVETESGENRIEGHAAVFNSWSGDLGGFREIINQGAFRKCIKKSDVRGLINHDSNLVLARSKFGEGTLRLKEDKDGLFFSLGLPDTSFARDLKESMRRGDIDQCSFGFRVAEDGDEFVEKKGLFERTITEVNELFDVSVVTFPAYADTSVALRKLDKLRESEGDSEDESTDDLECPHCKEQKLLDGDSESPDVNLDNEENAPEYVEPGLMAKYKAKLKLNEIKS